jgi:hypothetical protein
LESGTADEEHRGVRRQRVPKNPDAQIRVINWDPPMTHYCRLELPKQLAAAGRAVGEVRSLTLS